MKSVKYRRRVFKAFTLLELIIAIAIIAILSAVLVPNTIERVRTTKIESANALAYELYSATQNYLTDQQIKNKSLVFTSEQDGVFPVNKGTSGVLKGKHKDKIIFGVKADALTAEYMVQNNDFSRTTGVDAAKADAAAKKVVNGINRYLGTMDSSQGTNGYFWAAQVDINTYTVDWVVCSEQKNAQDAVFAVVNNYNNTSNNFSHLYTHIFSTGTENAGYVNGYYVQEYDVNHGKQGAYVGQYPIPFGS